MTSAVSQFTGKERDAESALDYFGARYYASTMGRFMTPDQAADDGESSAPPRSGRRVKKSTGPLYWYSAAGDVLAESSASGTLTAEYVFFHGRRIARRDAASGAIRYYFSDHLGSASVITNEAGTIMEESQYFPFGAERAVLNGDTNPYKFTGKERDSETGLDYFGARYYGSTMGRWLSPDVDESAEALPYADLDDPQTLNLYGYVRNNPLSLIDPDGHMQCHPKAGDPGTIICDPDPPKKDQPKEEPPTDPCGFLCQQVFHTPQAQRTWDLSARVTNKYIATPLLTFLSVAVPGALEAAGPTMETSLGTAIVSGATKAAAKQAVEDAAMTAAQKAAVKRAIARATAKESVSVERLADGSIRVLKSRPGFDGSQVISTIVKESGQSSTVQVGVSATGEVTHYHPK